MSVDYTTTALIAQTKRRGFQPAGSGLTSADILQILTEQLRTYIPAFLKGIREEYIVASLEIAVTSDTIAAPERAVGAAFRTITWVDPVTAQPYPLPRIEPERIAAYGLVSASQPCGYYFQGDNIILIPAVTSGTAVLTYQQRPGQLVLPDACGVVTGYEDTLTLDVSGLPNSITAGVSVDIVSPTPNFQLLALDLVVAGVIDLGGGISSVSFGGDDLPGTFTDAYMCLAGETPIPQIPTEVHDLLAQAAAYKIAEATGSSRLGAISKGLDDLRRDMTTILSPRSDGSARPIINRGGAGARRWIW